MNHERVTFPWKGYLLIPEGDLDGYKGVDRRPFVPTLIEDELDRSATDTENETRISRFYPPGWRRDAYQIYEDNLVEDIVESLDLLSSLDSARSISQILDSYVGKHEIFYCEIFDLGDSKHLGIDLPDHLFGIDVAYPGGDFYSAIYNGLFINPAPQLEEGFRAGLNNQGLFDDLDLTITYLRRFREVVVTEKESEFVIYILTKVQ
jgi:hypothetical protein